MWKKLREKQRNRQECTTAAAVVRILGGKFLEVHTGPYAQKNGQTDAQKMENYLMENNTVDFPKSAEKICKMLRRYEDDDFTSFWV